MLNLHRQPVQAPAPSALRPTVIRTPRNPENLFAGWGIRF